MRCTVEARDLVSALRALAPVGHGSKVSPITSCVLVDVGKSVRFSAADGQHWMRTEICAPRDADPGRVAVPLKTLAGVAGSMSGVVTLSQSGAREPLLVVSGRSHLKLAVQDVDDFPRAPGGSGDDVGEPAFTTDWAHLSTLLSPVEFASQDDTRFILNGICLELSDGPAFAAATDGHRLDVRGVTGVETKAARVIVLHRDACEAARAFAGEPTIRVHLTDTTARFSDDRGTVLVTRLVDGKFPAWREVLPKANTTTARLEAPALLDAVRRVALLTDHHAPAVRLVVGDGGIELSTSSADTGEARDLVDAGTDGKTLRLGINAKYLADALRGRVGSVEVAGSDELSPLLLTFADGARHVIMPMRTT